MYFSLLSIVSKININIQLIVFDEIDQLLIKYIVIVSVLYRVYSSLLFSSVEGSDFYGIFLFVFSFFAAFFFFFCLQKLFKNLPKFSRDFHDAVLRCYVVLLFTLRVGKHHLYQSCQTSWYLSFILFSIFFKVFEKCNI